jgi:DNA-binding NarL/FixJ family response regulator
LRTPKHEEHGDGRAPERRCGDSGATSRLPAGLVTICQQSGASASLGCGATSRVAKRGSVVDPALVQGLVAARRLDDPLERLTRREAEVLALMAEGLSNAGIARRLWVTERTVEKHVHSIPVKLPAPETEHPHRRVLAVLAYLAAR